MKTTTSLNRIRIAPRKMRMVVDLVRGKNVAVAKDLLRFRSNKGARILLKFLEAAVASAKTLGQGDESTLSIFKIAVDEGAKLKRWRERAKGSAYPIQKKVSSITLILDEMKGGGIIPGRSLEARRPAEQDKARLERPREAEQSASRPKFKAVPRELKASRTEKGFQRFFRRKAIG